MSDRMIELVDLAAHRTFHLIKDNTFKLRFVIFVQFYADTFLSKIKRMNIGEKRRIKIHRQQIEVIVFILCGIRIRCPVGRGHGVHKGV